MARPMPRPPWVRVLELSAWRKRSNTCGSSAGAMPCPVSLTAISTLALDLAQTHVDAPTLGRELDGVGQEIPDHLLQAIGVARHRPGPRVERGDQGQILARGGGAHGLDRRLHHRDRVHDPDFEAQLAADDPRDVEQVLDQLALSARVPLDGLERARGRRGVEARGTQGHRPAQHGVERRAQLVGERGEELVLHAVGRLGLLARPVLAGQQPHVANGDGRVIGQLGQDQPRRGR